MKEKTLFYKNIFFTAFSGKTKYNHKHFNVIWKHIVSVWLVSWETDIPIFTSKMLIGLKAPFAWECVPCEGMNLLNFKAQFYILLCSFVLMFYCEGERGKLLFVTRLQKGL